MTNRTTPLPSKPAVPRPLTLADLEAIPAPTREDDRRDIAQRAAIARDWFEEFGPPAAAAKKPARELSTLPSVEVVAELPPKDVPGFLVHLAALLSVAGARLGSQVTQPVPTSTEATRHVTQQEAAAQSGVKLRTVRFLTRTGRIPSLPSGRHRLVIPADLDRYLAECREKGVAVGMLPGVASADDRQGSARRAKEARTDAGRFRPARRR